MAKIEYTTRDGDMLDQICKQYYGDERNVLDEVLDANPGLADVGPVFVAGLKVYLPEVAPASLVKTVRLWD